MKFSDFHVALHALSFIQALQSNHIPYRLQSHNTTNPKTTVSGKKSTENNSMQLVQNSEVA